GERAAVHFDGKDDRLELPAFDQALDQFTLFVFAAPGASPGGFPGLVALNEIARRDYTSGFNLDLGPLAAEGFEVLNLEGKGFGGAADLMNDAFPLGTFHTLEVRVGPGKDGVALRVDGRAQGRRDRSPGKIVANELTLGARYYSNIGGPSYVQ